jgi:hypothetical protein
MHDPAAGIYVTTAQQTPLAVTADMGCVLFVNGIGSEPTNFSRRPVSTRP